jgi:hypothetical protein
LHLFEQLAQINGIQGRLLLIAFARGSAC